MRAYFSPVFAVALLLVLATDLALRAAGPGWTIGYAQNAQARPAILRHALAYGSPPVVFLGNSRTNQGIHVPAAQDALDRAWTAAGRDGEAPRALSYASGGAQTLELLSILRYVLRQEPAPEVVVMGVDMLLLTGPPDLQDRAAMFWDREDYRVERARFGAAVAGWWPTMLRAALVEPSYLMRGRGRLEVLVEQKLGGIEPHPMRGEVHPEFVGRDQDKGLVPSDKLWRTVQTFFLEDKVGPDGDWLFDAQRLAMWRDLAAACEARGVRLLLFESVNAPFLDEYLDPDQLARARAFYAELAAGAELVEFLSVAELGLDLPNEDFKDPLHTNRRGALALTAAVLEELLLPALGLSGR